MKSGQILEFIEEGRIVTAVCLEERKGRIRALTEFQRQVLLPPSRLVHCSAERLPTEQRREQLSSTLQARSARRQELAARINVRELWEVLGEEGGEYHPEDLAELAFGGEIDDDHTSAVIRAMLADRVFFRFRPAGFRPNDPETVEKILTQRTREAEKERLIEQGSRWIREVWEGHDVERPADWPAIVELLQEQAIHGKNAPRARHCEELLRRAGMTRPLAPFQILVRLGIWSPDENLLMYRFATRRTFPPAVKEEARNLMKPGRFPTFSDPQREDLTALPAITIDSPHTRDLDDALSIEATADGLQVGIHITDVSAVVPRDSALDREAALRGASLYLPEERIPMLPPEISEDRCSLKEGESRPTVSLLLKVDGEARVLDSWFCLAWIRVQQRLSYEEADEAAAEMGEGLRALLRLARLWREERIARGALLLPLPEVTVRIDETGEVLLERRDRESPSQILVSEMMIQANRLAAQHLVRSGTPAIFRTQEEPRERIVEGPVGDLFLNYKQRRLLNRAEFQLRPDFHHGLGEEAYTTITSPIRRYLDLVVQRQLTATIRKQPPPYSRDDLEAVLMESEEVLSQAAQMEQARQRYWLLRYLEERRGEETPAMVLGRSGKHLQLLLTEYMTEASIHAASAPRLQEGQRIQVRIGRVKPMENELRVEACCNLPEV